MFVNLQPAQAYDAHDRGTSLAFHNNQWRTSGVLCHGHYVFVVLPSTNPFDDLSDHNDSVIEVYVSTRLHHDDLALGNSVHYAGTVDFNQGVIVKWSNHSGHYQPYAIFRDQAPRDFDTTLFEVVLNDGSKSGILNNGMAAPPNVQ
jgi:hypothetical protein